MALTPDQEKILATFVRGDVRPLAFDAARFFLAAEDVAEKYVNDVAAIVAQAQNTDDIDERRDDGLPSRQIAELKALLTILNTIRNSITDQQKADLRKWLVSGRVRSF